MISNCFEFFLSFFFFSLFTFFISSFIILFLLLIFFFLCIFTFILFFFFFNDTPPTEIYSLPLHAALPIFDVAGFRERLAGLQPMLDTIGIGDPCEPAVGIEQHDDDRAAGDGGKHDQALARLADEAGLAELDVPLPGAYQRVGVVVAKNAAGGLHFDVVTRGRRRVADQLVARRGFDHP